MAELEESRSMWASATTDAFLTPSLRTSAAALVWQSVPLALASPVLASGGPIFFGSWPKKIGEKKGRFPFRKLSRQPSYLFAGRGLLGTWEGI